ncbi:MAG: dual specificity protein phosphatase family protein [Campylobacterales bacterium]|nr:dual specificity protein phosphatase family protein [Campylobacterales bacterium]
MQKIRYLIKDNYFKLILLTILLFAGGWGYYIVYGGNFGIVEKGVLYRSAQPDKEDIKYYADKYGIQSILNLRGSDTNDWYTDEIQISRELGITHYDLELGAYHEFTDVEMHTLIQILKTAPKPMLIHCFGGADRTGLASAIYVFTIKGKSSLEAKKNLSLLHGHLPYLGNGTVAMDKTFEKFVFEYNFKDPVK